MDHKALLTDLGGPHAVHAELVKRPGLAELKPVTVRAWALTDRAIPAKYWAVLAEIAQSKGKQVSFEDLANSVRAA